MGRVDDLTLQGPPAGGNGESDVIGGFAAPVSPRGRTVAMTGPMGAVPVQTQLDAQQPAYLAGAEKAPASLPVEDQAALQVAMARAGVLTGEFRVGVWDGKSANAYKEVLALANAQGVSDMEALNMYASAPKAGGAPAFRPGRYLPPDPAVHRQAVRAMFAEVGLEPDEDEVEQIASQLRRSERGAFREARGEYNELGGGGVEEFNAEYERSSEDMAARFAEAFQQRVAGRVEFRQAQEQSALSDDLLGSILGTIDEVA